MTILKLGLITFHRAINYGGVLQTFALQQAIEKAGANVEIIDYYCPAIEKMYRPKFKDWFRKNNIKRVAAVFLKNGILLFNNKKFSNFRNNYLKTSDKRYLSHEDLRSAQYDKYITGSDQVWSPVCAGFDTAYFLDFVTESKKKNSYAASFGVGAVNEELHNKYYELLHDYNQISVRENDGAKIIKSILNKDVDVVPDPTLLLNKREWGYLFSQKRDIKDRYILIYMISEDNALINKAKELSKKTGLKIYYVNDRFYKKRGVINLRKVSPEQWVNLFFNAEYIFTNSFHGVAFSINFKKNFFVKALNQNQKVNSRIFNILEHYNLKLDDFNELVQNDEIDKLLEADRRKGNDYLTKILED